MSGGLFDFELLDGTPICIHAAAVESFYPDGKGVLLRTISGDELALSNGYEEVATKLGDWMGGSNPAFPRKETK